MSSAVWFEYLDEQSGCFYYYNILDSSTQWEPPVNRNGELIPCTKGYEESYKNPDKSEGSIKSSGSWREVDPGILYSERSIATTDSERKVRKGKGIIRSLEPVARGSTQDYIGMAKIYELERIYREKSSSIKCVLCFRNMCTSVFFPCEHMCVCSNCIAKENICAENSAEDEADFCLCPLCNSVIKKILPFEGGKEVEKYWYVIGDILRIHIPRSLNPYLIMNLTL
jgi:hypothetical protein